MKNQYKVLIGIGIISFIGLSFISNHDKEFSQEPELSTSKYEKLVKNPTLAENEFINNTIENLLDLQYSFDELKPFFLYVNEKDSGWRVKVQFILSQLGAAGNNISEIYLNEEQKEKYAATIKANDLTMSEIKSLRDDIENAMYTYDGEALNSSYHRINKINTLIETTLDTLDEERYQ